MSSYHRQAIALAYGRNPVPVVTAKGEDVDRINGLEIGADDYLGKPFNPRELLARIHAVLRRRPVNELPGSPSAEDEVINFGPFKLDLGSEPSAKTAWTWR
jgi:two-component system phosphate regulon response regulator OmpR